MMRLDSHESRIICWERHAHGMGGTKGHLGIGQQRSSRVGPGADRHWQSALVWHLHRQL